MWPPMAADSRGLLFTIDWQLCGNETRSAYVS
jgi:hypothetical protein